MGPLSHQIGCKPCDGPEPSSKCLRRQTITPHTCPEMQPHQIPELGARWPPSACQHFLRLNAGDAAAFVDAAESCMRPGGFSALAQALHLWKRGRRIGVGDCCFSSMLTHLPPICAHHSTVCKPQTPTLFFTSFYCEFSDKCRTSLALATR